MSCGTCMAAMRFVPGKIYIPPGVFFLVVFRGFYPLPLPEIDPVFLKFHGKPEGERDGEGEVRHWNLCKKLGIG